MLQPTVCTGTNRCSDIRKNRRSAFSFDGFLWRHASQCTRHQGQRQACKGVLSSLAKTLRSEGSLCSVGPAVCASRAPTFRLSRCSALLSSGSCCALPTLTPLPVPALPLQYTPPSHHVCRASPVHLHLAHPNYTSLRFVQNDDGRHAQVTLHANRTKLHEFGNVGNGQEQQQHVFIVCLTKWCC